MRAPALGALGLGLLALGLWQAGSGGYIHAKAWLAQQLIGRAWAAVRAGDAAARPWPWADTAPVARLIAPGPGVELTVLSGASGRTLAFGPAHVGGTPAPGAPGTSVLAAHRDTHFAFLRTLAPGDRLRIERPDGTAVDFRVTEARAVHRDALRVPLDRAAPHLLLVTCWPFDALRAGGPMRYAVTAVADPAGPS